MSGAGEEVVRRRLGQGVSRSSRRLQRSTPLESPGMSIRAAANGRAVPCRLPG